MFFEMKMEIFCIIDAEENNEMFSEMSQMTIQEMEGAYKFIAARYRNLWIIGRDGCILSK